MATHTDQMIAIRDCRIRLMRGGTVCIRHLARRQNWRSRVENKLYQNDTDVSKSIVSE
jgi:hypothetical protein